MLLYSTLRHLMLSFSLTQQTCCKKWSLGWDTLIAILWICCLSHAGVRRNDWTDTLASTADRTSSLHLHRAEVLRGLRNFLNVATPEHHSSDHMITSKVWNDLCSTRLCHCYKGDLGDTAERWGRACMGFSSTVIPSWVETKWQVLWFHLEWKQRFSSAMILP